MNGIPQGFGDVGPAIGDPIPGPPQGVHGSAPADIIDFLEHATAKGPIDCITLYQEMFDGTKEKVRDIGVKAIDPIAMAENLARIVVNRTNDRGKRSTFILEAWAGAEMRGTHIIKRDVQAAGPSSVAAEPPTEAGFTAQLMRHYEVTQRQTGQIIDANFGHLARVNRELMKENAELRAREIGNMVLLRDNLIASADIEYRREQNRLKVHVQAQVFTTLIQALPSIIQRFTANEVVEKFRVFASQLTPDQQMAIGAALNQEQVQQLASLFKALETPKLPGQVTQALTEGAPPPPAADPTAAKNPDKPAAAE
jgi:hypothetical protein